MVNVLHKNLTGADAVHPAAFVQSTDPGAVGANLQWIDTSSGPPYTLRLRNPANTAWLEFAAGPTGDMGATGGTGAQGDAGNPGAITVTIAGGQPYMCFQDQKPSGTAGGTFTSGAWQTRTLNTILANDLSLAVLDRTTNRVTLPAGTYRCRALATGSQVNNHKARLRNITDSATALMGITARSVASGTWSTSISEIAGTFAIASSKTFEVQHQCSTTEVADGFGVASNFGENEVYTVAEFWLVAGPPPFFGSTRFTENPSTGRLPTRRLVAGLPMPQGYVS